MGLPVTVYRWDDAGAPQLSTPSSSEIIAILKKCLVEGYGNKASLGWTNEFESADGKRVVFRNSPTSGTGSYVRFDATPTGSWANNVHIKTAQIATGLDDLQRVSYQKPLAVGEFDKGWVLIGTERGFYFQLRDSRTTDCVYYGSYDYKANKQLVFVGDINSYHGIDAGAFTVLLGDGHADDQSGTYGESLATLVSDHKFNKLYDTDGFDHSSNMYMKYNTPYITSRALAGTVESRGVTPMYFKVILSEQAFAVQDRVGIPAYLSTTSPFIRGDVPGYLMCNCNGYLDTPWPLIIDINGVDYFGMTNPVGVQFFVNLESWYD